MDTPEGRLCKRGDEAPFDSAPRVKNPFVSGTRSVSIRCCAIPISEEGGEGMERVVGSTIRRRIRGKCSVPRSARTIALGTPIIKRSRWWWWSVSFRTRGRFARIVIIYTEIVDGSSSRGETRLGWKKITRTFNNTGMPNGCSRRVVAAARPVPFYHALVYALSPILYNYTFTTRNFVQTRLHLRARAILTACTYASHIYIWRGRVSQQF